MAFCPNCGTANTEQAEKCTSCGFALSPAPQKARFKGTIMMSGTQLPAGVVPSAAPPVSPAQPAAPAQPKAAEATPGPAQAKPFARTMLGAAISAPIAKPAGAPAHAADPIPTGDDLGSAATMMHGAAAAPYARTVEAAVGSAGTPMPEPAVHVPAPAAPPPVERAPDPAPAQAARPATMSAGGGGFSGQTMGSSGNTFSSTNNSLTPPPKAGAGKAVLFGCAGALVVACIGAFALYSFGRSKLDGLLDQGSEQSTLAWQQSVGQAVVQVAQLCAQDCNAAAIYFHPQTQAALLPEAKQLTPARAEKLTAPGAVQARMLADTDDGAVATKLNLDPSRCVLLALGQAKVVGCSVIDETGADSLRIVHLASIGSL